MKIALVVPSALKMLPFDMVWSFFHAFAYLESRQDDLPFEIDHLEIIAPKTFPIDANRNMAVAQLIEKGFDMSIWFDADQTFPKNMIFRLLLNPEPIVAGMYFIKGSPFYPVIYRETKDSKKSGAFNWFNPIVEYPENECFHADMIGMGCVKIATKVFKDIAKIYGDEKPEFFRYGINPVTIEENEIDTPDLNKYRDKYLIRDVTEDVFFWKLVRDHTDYKILVDPKVQCGHITEIISNQNLFKNFYETRFAQIEKDNPEEAKKIKDSICRAEPAKKAS